MKVQSALFDFALKEWLLLVSAAGVAITSAYTRHLPAISIPEVQVLFILFALFVAVKGLQQSGLISRFSLMIERGKAMPLKLVVTTFFLSMLITNDVTLIIIVPLTLALNIRRRDILVILEALAANAGSALTPFGNPQNLYIYWFYDLHITEFIGAIAPFSLVFLVILYALAFTVKGRVDGDAKTEMAVTGIDKSSYIYGVMFVVVLLTVLHILPVVSCFIVIIYALLLDRKALRIDYAILVSFLFFFGLAENIKIMLAPEISHSGHVFILSALASQVMSNVPAALLFAKFTTNWEALLWGTNAGGFGSLFGSMANLIAYKLYITNDSTNNPASFTVKFLVIGYAAFFLSFGLYYLVGTT